MSIQKNDNANGGLKGSVGKDFGSKASPLCSFLILRPAIEVALGFANHTPAAVRVAH
jgi:hypothetical protein